MGRYFEIDTVRGIALLCMIVYHVIYCLAVFTPDLSGISSIFQIFYTVSPLGTAVFVGLAGLSLVLAKKTTKDYLLRGGELIVLGLLITLVTWIFYPSEFVVFGVLSLIGAGTILAIPLLSEKIPWYAIAGIGIIIILLDLVVSKIYLTIPYFLPFGLKYYEFVSVDYEPLIPWFGVLLIGIAIGKFFYPRGKRIAVLEKLGEGPKVFRPLCFLGRHTLIIYLVHVPIILALLLFLGLIPISTFF